MSLLCHFPFCISVLYFIIVNTRLEFKAFIRGSSHLLNVCLFLKYYISPLVEPILLVHPFPIYYPSAPAPGLHVLEFELCSYLNHEPSTGHYSNLNYYWHKFYDMTALFSS